MSLVVVGLWLAVLGAADLGRAGADTVGRTRQALCLALGLAVLVPGLLLVRPSGAWGLLLGLVLAALLGAWLVSTGWALDPRRPPRHRARARVAAFGAVGLGLLVALLAVQVVDHEVTWPAWTSRTLAARWPAADLVVAGGAVLVQLATGNLLVRLLLDAVGVPATSNEKRLRGGRVLGPMERLFVLGLGGVGELTAAAVVVAAKGLLRFPELQRAQLEPRRLAPAPDGPSDVTEYFLIGSFASWLLALAGVALVHLA
ncbi:hypothetical protein [Nocardioides sp. GY 10127]|uniref:hypothetical protein n=1 Tax=Nocardioides sp. GY 10127 TaxID=2569762 RepID=UPI0010A89FBE|nr:hypothetical protein [Nocardioides sp. GY 10127]TIC86418.1 hypothetical protein E8D37_00455 [Nocardioides sp. GY 10127]